MTEPDRRPRLIPAIAAALGVALAILGVSLVLRQPPASFGWFADAPLTAGSAAPAGILLGPLGIAGAVAIGMGIGLAAFAGGWMLGRRRAPRDPARPIAD